MTKKITIGSRGSKLALIYAHNAKKKILQNTNLESELLNLQLLLYQDQDQWSLMN